VKVTEVGKWNKTCADRVILDDPLCVLTAKRSVGSQKLRHRVAGGQISIMTSPEVAEDTMTARPIRSPAEIVMPEKSEAGSGCHSYQAVRGRNGETSDECADKCLLTTVFRLTITTDIQHIPKPKHLLEPLWSRIRSFMPGNSTSTLLIGGMSVRGNCEAG
jgi:hypothetical protein